MSQKQALLRTDDWLAVWLGFLIIAVVLVGLRPTMPKFAWVTDAEFATTAADSKAAVEKIVSGAKDKGEADL